MQAGWVPGRLHTRGVLGLTFERCTETFTINEGEHAMGKSQDAKKNVKKAASKTPKEKKEAKRLKKAEKR